MVVESLALWGIPSGVDFIFGSGLIFENAADAAEIYNLIPSKSETWKKLSNHTIYFVQGSGTVAETLKTAISKNDFKYYDDQEALSEVTLLPDGGTTKLAAVCIVKPSKTLIKILVQNTEPGYSSMLNMLFTWGKLQVITAGLYAPQQIDVGDIAQQMERGSKWESNFGILASVKSGLPGFLVSPIVTKLLKDAGYASVNLGESTLYDVSFDVGNGEVIPVLLRIEGNRIFAATSGQKSYAEKLITSVSR